VWRKLRAAVRAGEPFCASCQARGKLVPSAVVDHVEPHRGDWSKFVDRANLQALCKSCHDGAKQRAEKAQAFGRDGWPLER
jgi:5-methylcytosine-specific restriction protein A